jgi:hypothetical protein
MFDAARIKDSLNTLEEVSSIISNSSENVSNIFSNIPKDYTSDQKLDSADTIISEFLFDVDFSLDNLNISPELKSYIINSFTEETNNSLDSFYKKLHNNKLSVVNNVSADTEKLAIAGDIEACFVMATFSDSITSSEKKKLLSGACDSDHPEACFELSKIYNTEKNVEKYDELKLKTEGLIKTQDSLIMEFKDILSSTDTLIVSSILKWGFLSESNNSSYLTSRVVGNAFLLCLANLPIESEGYIVLISELENRFSCGIGFKTSSSKAGSLSQIRNIFLKYESTKYKSIDPEFINSIQMEINDIIKSELS